MIDYKAEVTVNVPAEKVFAAVTDEQKWSMWTPMQDTKVLVGSGFKEVGSQVESVMVDSPGKPKLVFEVTAVEKNRRLSFKTISKSSIQWDGDFKLEPQGSSSTHLVSTGQIRSSGLLKLMEFFMSGEIKKGEQKELEKLKELLESNKM